MAQGLQSGCRFLRPLPQKVGIWFICRGLIHQTRLFLCKNLIHKSLFFYVRNLIYL
jgi:hypothetical protein